MKKQMLYTGMAYAAAGCLCLLLALCTNWQIEPLLWGLFGAGAGSGLMMIGKYLYWTRGDRRAAYDARLKAEQINLHDERKIMLRDKSGAIVYRTMLMGDMLLTFICSILSILEIGKPFTLYLTITFALLAAIQYLLGIAVFRHLEKKL